MLMQTSQFRDSLRGEKNGFSLTGLLLPLLMTLGLTSCNQQLDGGTGFLDTPPPAPSPTVSVSGLSMTQVTYTTTTATVQVSGTVSTTLGNPLTPVSFYSNLYCTGTNVGIGTIGDLSSTGVNITLPSTSSTEVYAQLNIDPGCYSIGVFFPAHPAPAAPTFVSLTPTSPSSTSTTPIVTGAVTGVVSEVYLYSDALCTQSLGSATAAIFTSTGIQVTVPANATTKIYAKAQEPFGGFSPCVLMAPFANASIIPQPPTYLGIAPASPSNSSTTPTVTGTLPVNAATISIFSDPACANSLGSTSYISFMGSGITFSVPQDATTQIYAQDYTAAGVPSNCVYFTSFTNNTIGPGAPSWVSTNPTSPTRMTIYPLIKGVAGTNTVFVQLFSNPSCTTNSQIGTGTAAQFQGTGIQVTVATNATTTIYAQDVDSANNTSACTHLFDFINDAVAPNAPAFGATNPASPNNSTTVPLVILVSGTFQTGSLGLSPVTVNFFSDVACTNQTGTGTAVAFSGVGVPVTVQQNTSNYIYATSVDSIGNTSACTFITTFDNSTAVAPAPVFVSTSPASPSNSVKTPLIAGTVPVSVVRVELYLDPACATPVVTGNRISFQGGLQVSVPKNASTAIYGRATDKYGNLSACTYLTNYIYNVVPPTPPHYVLATPASPENTTLQPVIQGTVSPLTAPTSVLPATSIIYFDSSTCSNQITTSTVAQFMGAGAQITIPSNETSTIYAETQDDAGTRSACTFLTNYTHDSLPPGVPVFGSATPMLPNYNSYSQFPTIVGTLGSTIDPLPAVSVTLYSNSTCTSAVLGTTTPALFSTVGIPITVPVNTTTTIYGQVADQIGNLSGSAPFHCTSLLNYVQSNQGPGNLVANQRQDGQVDLSWDIDPNAVYYIVQRSTVSGGPYTILNALEQNTVFNDQATTQGVTYYYTVASQNSTGTTLNSPEVPVTIAAVTPNPPTAVTAVTGPAAINLAWTGDSTSMSFSIYRGTHTGGPYTRIATGIQVSTYTDNAVTNGSPYFYVITSTNSLGESAYSSEVSGTPEVMVQPPYNLQISAIQSGGMELSWGAPSYYTGFQVSCGTSHGSYTQVLASNVQTFNYQDGNYLWSNTYNPNYCVVQAQYGGALSGYSNEVSFADMGGPSVTANEGDGNVLLSWNAPDIYAIDYAVYRSTSITGPFNQIAASTSSSLLYVDNTVTNGQTYYYVVRSVYNLAYNTLGHPSAVAVASPGSDVLTNGPTNLTLDVIVLPGTPNVNRLPTLTWTPTQNYNYFNVYRSPTGAAPWTQIASKLFSPTYQDALPLAGRNYYAVTSTWGNAETSKSNIVSLQNGFPATVTAAPAAASITISWSAVPGVTGYNVYKSTTSGGPYSTTVCTGVLAPRTCVDNSVIMNTGYYYIVVAQFASGGPGQNSLEVPSMTTTSNIPGSLTMTNMNGSQLSLNWTPVSGATKYYVLYSMTGVAPFTLISTITLPLVPNATVNLPSNMQNKFYTFVVESVVSGVTSAPSTGVYVYTGSSGLAPTYTLGSGTVTLSWFPTPGAMDYVVQESTDGITYNNLSPVVGNACNGNPPCVTSPIAVSAGTLYFFRYYSEYSGVPPFYSASTAVSAGLVPSVPAAPTIKWSNGNDVFLVFDSTPNATGNQVYESIDGGSFNLVPGVVANFNSNSSPLSIYNSGLITTGHTYAFTVNSLNGGLASAQSAPVYLSTVGLAGMYNQPPAPTTEVNNLGQVNVIWSQVSCAVGGGAPYATQYDVQQSVNGNNFTTIVSGTASLSYTDTSVSSGNSYIYQYLAYCGSAPPVAFPMYSAQSTAVSTAGHPIDTNIAPLAPTGISVDSNAGINLAWVPVPTAAYYNVYRATVSGGPYTMINAAFTPPLLSSPAPATTYLDSSSLAPGNYYYVVTTLNTSAVESPYSSEVSVVIGLNAPASLTATPTVNQITLNWPSVGGSTGYIVRRSLTSGGPYGYVTTLGSGVLTYTDTNITNGLTYYYVVAAKGGGTTVSPDSTEAQATAQTGMNLQVPIELTDQAMSSGLAGTNFLRTQTSLNTTNYDGTVTYNFSVVATNTDSVVHTVQLVDSNFTSVATIDVPGSTTQATRLSVAFTPDAGLMQYTVKLAGTSSAGQLVVDSARVLVNQTNATKTMIYIPLLSTSVPASNADASAPVYTTSSTSYGGSYYSTYFKKNSTAYTTLNPYNAWTLETVVEATGGATGSVLLYDVTQGNPVADTDLQFSSSTPILNDSQFDEGVTDFATINNGDLYEVRLACVTGCSSGAVNIYKAGLWVNLIQLTTAEVFYRTSLGPPSVYPINIDVERTLLSLSLFSNPTTYFQAVGALQSGGGAHVELMDDGLNESGTAGITAVSGSSLIFGTASKSWQRSGSITITSGDRFLTGLPDVASSVELTDSSIIIDTHR